MPTLFPPLEPEGDGDSFLPADVRANFEAIQAIVRAQSRLAKGRELSASIESASLGSDDKKPNDAGDEGVEGEGSVVAVDAEAQGLESRKRTLAVAAAVAVQDEISRLTNGIAELESLLVQQGNDVNVNPSQIEFPALPTVIADEETEENQEKGSGSSEVRESDSKKED